MDKSLVLDHFDAIEPECEYFDLVEFWIQKIVSQDWQIRVPDRQFGEIREFSDYAERQMDDSTTFLKPNFICSLLVLLTSGKCETMVNRVPRQVDTFNFTTIIIIKAPWVIITLQFDSIDAQFKKTQKDREDAETRKLAIN